MEVSDEEKQLAEDSHPPPPPRPSPLVHHHQPHPWLVISHGKCHEKQTFFSISENRYYPRMIPEMSRKWICTSNFGWMVLKEYYESTGDCFLFNLASMEKVKLPNLKGPLTAELCILSSPPSEPDCHIIFADPKNRTVLLCQPGDKKYVKLKFGVDDHWLISATTFQGKVFGLTRSSNIGFALLVADLTASIHQFRQLIRPSLRSPSRPEIQHAENYLIGSQDEDELFFVHKIFLGFENKEVTDFKIYRADFSTMTWVEVETIGKRTIFLDPSRGLSTSSSFSVEGRETRGNCIYFTEIDDRSLYVFDLEDRSMSVSLPCPYVRRDNVAQRWVWF